MSAPDPVARRARRAVCAVFLTNGAVLANVVPRYPEIKDALGLSDGQYGTALAAIPLGALVASLFAPALIQRFRSSLVATAGMIALALGILGVGTAPGVVLLVAALLAVGAADAFTDVAQNAHGLRVQRIYRRSIVNAFHGFWSVGAVLGGLMGSAAAALRIPILVHLGASAAIFAVVILLAKRAMLPGPEDAESRARAEEGVAPAAPTAPPPRRRNIPRATALALGLLGLVALCGTFVEDTGAAWAAVYLGRDLGAGPGTAGLGFVALNIAMTIGRLTGDRFTDRYGAAAVVRTGGLITAAGMGLALAFPSVPLTILGLAAAGFGVATHIPAAMHAGDELPGLRPGVGLSVISWIMRAGFLISPLIVGWVSDLSSLRVGLLVVVVAGVASVFCAGKLSGRPQRSL